MSTVVDSHSYTYTAPMDYSFSRHANSAGAPLPRIPRRSASSRTATAASSSTAAAIHSIFAVAASAYSPPATPAALVVHPPTPPRLEPSAQPSESEETTSSSSSSETYVQMLNPRTRRVRKPKMNPLRAPADSTPTPAVLKAKTAQENGVAFPAQKSTSDDATSGNETPRQSTYSSRASMRIDLDSLKQPLGESSSMAVRSESSSSGRTVSAPQANAASIARKKSGEPLKSSLKSRRPIVRGDLSVVTGISSTKSEPSTPMASKSVHFDAQLEKVKLFLAEQKPIAISREGSPTDTSGTESDFPSSIYGSRREDEDKMLTMQVTNMPAAPPADAELALEGLVLSPEGTALNGTVRVKNLAFEKWVAVRFTVDWWQTTSEVTARYAESIEGGVFDRFSFSIRLGDMLARIEEKTLFFALRYNVAGREIWDNNGSQNYKVTFAKVLRPRASQSADSGLASLKSKLESVVRGQETVGGYVAHGRKTRAESFTLQASTSLASRYDFAASLKSPWRPSPVASPSGSHSRTSTYPNALPQYPRRMATKQAFNDGHPLTRGSPRILDHDDDTPTPPAFHVSAADLEDTPVPIMSRRRGRNHQRGYFDLGIVNGAASVKRTPSGSPGTSPRLGSLSPMAIPRSARTPEQVAHATWYVERGGSEESTPSATSTSESSRSSSPSGSPVEDPLMYNYMSAGADRETVGGVRSPVESDSYNVFLNRYCYYTGATDPFLDAQPDVIHRSHSASSVEEFLSSPNPNYLLSPGEAPTRSPSFDDVVSMSGASTPTARSMGMVGAASPPLLSIAH
ncbi:carbohydrate-binding module family 21 protein [Trametes coccinea BRFM310]|uniref:Carbohydrate-binding module family 21 protein n=1 Tax=Trametes coccinea (strain BRFM310) TaxID=1353009 RepID=A0A1Y2IN75_TRAC3|nr:carbohydrate-binding module family 21 protein [Trametes coccinea BRFM310]